MVQKYWIQSKHVFLEKRLGNIGHWYVDLKDYEKLKVPDLTRIVNCNESDIDQITNQINQDLKLKIKELEAKLQAVDKKD